MASAAQPDQTQTTEYFEKAYNLCKTENALKTKINAENNATICTVKDRVFGTKWVDVGNQVPSSLIEIICPELATLLAKEDKGGIVDLEHSEEVKAVLEKLAKAREDAPLSQNHCIRAGNRYDDMIT